MFTEFKILQPCYLPARQHLLHVMWMAKETDMRRPLLHPRQDRNDLVNTPRLQVDYLQSIAMPFKSVIQLNLFCNAFFNSNFFNNHSILDSNHLVNPVLIRPMLWLIHRTTKPQAWLNWSLIT